MSSPRRNSALSWILSRRLPYLGWVAVCAIGGCGRHSPRYPATGKVVFADNSPCEGCTIEFRSEGTEKKPFNLRGITDSQGTFELRGSGDAAGVPAGDYRAIVIGPTALPLGDVSTTRVVSKVPARFQDYDASGLKFTVEPRQNDFTITLK